MRQLPRGSIKCGEAAVKLYFVKCSQLYRFQENWLKIHLFVSKGKTKEPKTLFINDRPPIKIYIRYHDPVICPAAKITYSKKTHVSPLLFM